MTARTTDEQRDPERTPAAPNLLRLSTGLAGPVRRRLSALNSTVHFMTGTADDSTESALASHHDSSPPSDRPRRSALYRFLLVAVVLVALVGSFALGRVTAPETTKPATVNCSAYERTGISTPEAFAGSDGLAFFSQCEEKAARSTTFGGPSNRIFIYAAKTGDEVVAWWYSDCGSPEGIVAPGAARPASCGTTGTTAAP